MPFAVETGEDREQTVEVALGPVGAFENGNVGRLTRQLPLEPVINGVRSAMPPKPLRIPLVAETLRKAIEWQRELESGAVTRQADIARREGVSRARVTQVLMLQRLAPDIQESILALIEQPASLRLPERILRPIARIADPEQQVKAFEAATGHHP